MLNKLKEMKASCRAKYNRFTLIELMITIAILTIFLIAIMGIIAFVFVSCVAVDAVQEKGVKGVVEDVWEGPDAPVEGDEQ